MHSRDRNVEESTGGVRTAPKCDGTGSELVCRFGWCECVGTGSELVCSFGWCERLCILILTE